MEYIKENGKIYKVTTIKREVDLEGLKDRLAELKAEKEPSDKELIEEGRISHPYYLEKEEIPSLEAKIKEIEEAIK